MEVLYIILILIRKIERIFSAHTEGLLYVNIYIYIYDIYIHKIFNSIIYIIYIYIYHLILT